MPPADYYTKPEMDAKLDALAAKIDAKVDARANAIETKIVSESARLELAIEKALRPIGERLAAVERINSIVAAAILGTGIVGAVAWLITRST